MAIPPKGTKGRKKAGKKNVFGVLTSGGDAPGMNAAIRAVVRFGIAQGCEIMGIQKGYAGLLENRMEPMNLASVANVIQRGGTFLKTSRCPAFHRKAMRKKAARLLYHAGVTGLVVIGGDGSFAGASLLERETGLPTIGIPGTIDNDIYGSEDSIGFDTAVNTALDSIDRIRDTASSHDRLFVVEVMGRTSGQIALHVGVAGGAESILVPEIPFSLRHICECIERGVARGKSSSIIIVAEGAAPGGAMTIANLMKKRGYAPKVCILGHTQRGGTPTAHDRWLGSLLGALAVRQLMEGQSGGMMGVRKNQPVFVPYGVMMHKRKPLPREWLRLAGILAT